MTQTDSKRFRDFYRSEAPVYHRRRYESTYGSLFRTLHHDTLATLLGPPEPGQRLLEVACGTGHTTEFLVEAGFDVTACDLTPDMMRQARARVHKAAAQPDFSVADALALPFADGVFDAVVSTRFLHLFPVEEQEAVLAEAVRVLKPGGRLVVDFDNWSSRWLLSVPYLLYNMVRYRRFAPYSIYNRIRPTCEVMEGLGLRVDRALGIGGTHLVALAWLSPDLAVRAGIRHRTPPLRTFAEQFMVLGTRR